MKKVNLVGVDVSAKTFTVVVDHAGERSEAFDLENDPGETVNQFRNPDYREVKYALMEQLLQRLLEWQDPLPRREALW